MNVPFKLFCLTSGKDVLEKALILYKENKLEDLYDLTLQYPQYREDIEMTISYYIQLKKQFENLL